MYTQKRYTAAIIFLAYSHSIIQLERIDNNLLKANSNPVTVVALQITQCLHQSTLTQRTQNH